MSCMLPCGNLLSGDTGREIWQQLKLAAWEMSTSCLLMKSLTTKSSGSKTGLLQHFTSSRPVIVEDLFEMLIR